MSTGRKQLNLKSPLKVDKVQTRKMLDQTNLMLELCLSQKLFAMRLAKTLVAFLEKFIQFRTNWVTHEIYANWFMIASFPLGVSQRQYQGVTFYYDNSEFLFSSRCYILFRSIVACYFNFVRHSKNYLLDLTELFRYCRIQMVFKMSREKNDIRNDVDI